MATESEELNTLLDFSLLSKLIVGIGEVSDITGIPKKNYVIGKKKEQLFPKMTKEPLVAMTT